VRIRVTVESAVVLLLGVFGFRLGARPISDNSMFTHIRTGVDMVTNGSIPRADPYTFTAEGHPWVVQSWLAEWTYGLAEKAGGLRLVLLEQGLLTGLVAFLVARLARTGNPARTAVAGIIAVGAGLALWSPRPLLFGLVCFALVVTIVEEQRSPWLLIPVAWVWVNTHGSFLFGLLWLGAVLVGDAVDRRTVPRERIKVLLVFAAGLLAGAINPLGPRLLLFPFEVGAKADVFRRVVEWRSPDFQSFSGMFTLIFLLAALVVLLRSRPPWRDLIPVVGFLAMGLVALRNLPAAAIVLAPALGRALRPAEPRPATPVSPIFLGAVGVLAVLFAVTAAGQDPVDASSYPEETVAALTRDGVLTPQTRMAHQDFVGNYLELKLGTEQPVFIDDRVDMFPTSLSDDYRDLLAGNPGALAILDRWRIDVVLWADDRALVEILRVSGGWTERSHEDGYVVFVRKQ
jgi:hypothetical protein